MEEKIVICISNVSSPQKKKKNPVIQKEKIKPESLPAFQLVNSFYEVDVPLWIWQWSIFRFPFTFIEYQRTYVQMQSFLCEHAPWWPVQPQLGS